MGRKKQRLPFKHRKLPSHPVGCYGFLKPMPSKPDEYLYCTYCNWTVSMKVAEKYGYEKEIGLDRN